LPGMARLWAWEAFAHGAETVCYFRWRQAPFGQEQMHAGLLRPDRAPAPALAEAAQVASEIAAQPAPGEAPTQAAIVFDYQSAWAWGAQPQGRGFDYFRLVFSTYRALRQLGLNVDIVPSDTSDLSPWPLVVVPGLMAWNDTLRQAISAHQGRVVIGPRSGSKTADFAIPAALPPDFPELGVMVEHVETLRPDCLEPLSGGGHFHLPCRGRTAARHPPSRCGVGDVLFQLHRPGGSGRLCQRPYGGPSTCGACLDHTVAVRFDVREIMARPPITIYERVRMDAQRRAYGIEWPTLGLVAVTYSAWVVLLFAVWPLVPLWLTIGLMALVLTMHSSLQHEAIHGHPVPNLRLSAALMAPGLGLFVPFGRFRDLHLAHHKDANLTDPYDDPESHYFDPAHFNALPRWGQRMLVVNNTLLGRLILGPAIGMKGFLRTELQLIRAGSTRVRRDWAIHLATVLPVLALVWAAPLPIWAYLAASYLALSILKIRTFVEHQAHELSSGRSVIIEDRSPLSFLFLNNNLHSVHHAHPAVAWYDLPALYRSRRESFLARNRGYLFPSYLSIARRYVLRPKEPVVHPLADRQP